MPLKYECNCIKNQLAIDHKEDCPINLFRKENQEYMKKASKENLRKKRKIYGIISN